MVLYKKRLAAILAVMMATSPVMGEVHLISEVGSGETIQIQEMREYSRTTYTQIERSISEIGTSQESGIITWDFADEAFKGIDLQGEASEITTVAALKINAKNGKFKVRNTDVQMNAGTSLTIPVTGPCVIRYDHGYDSGTLKITRPDGQIDTVTYDAKNNWSSDYITYDGELSGELTITLESDCSSTYFKSLILTPLKLGENIITVGQDKDFNSVQKALDSIHFIPTEKCSVKIMIDPGVYEELVKVNKPYVTFENTNPKEEVKITYDRASGHEDPNKNYGTQQSATVTIEAEAKSFTARNITFENSYNLGENNTRSQTQAVAVVTLADQIIFDNCKFIARQDTLYLKGTSIGATTESVNEARVYLKDCYVEGTVDFIFGDSTAVFENCQLHMAYYKNGGHYTAANTHLRALGYVFNECTLTVSDEYEKDENGYYIANIDLGRPWQGDHTYPLYGSQSVFINCKIDKGISKKGWSAWDSNTITEKVRYMEYNSMDLDGNKLDVTGRLDWIRLLEEEQAKAYNTGNVLRGSDNWNPSDASLGKVEVADITLSDYRLDIPQGESKILKARILPITASTGVTYKSSNEQVATVTAEGEVSAIGKGTATIIATTEENNCTVTATVNVLPSRTEVPKVKEIYIEANKTILPGDEVVGHYSYELETDNENDVAKVQWYVVNSETGEEVLVQEGKEDFARTYKVAASDIGYGLKLVVIPEAETTYGNTGEPVDSEVSSIVSKPNYKVPETYIRESFSKFVDNYTDVSKLTDQVSTDWKGLNVSKAIADPNSGMTLLYKGEVTPNEGVAWGIVDTSGRAQDDADFNGNVAIQGNVIYQKNGSILVYETEEDWKYYEATARMRFSPSGSGFSSNCYFDTYINYNEETHTGYKLRLGRGSNTKSVSVGLYKVVAGEETCIGFDKTTFSNKFNQNAGEENPYFRVSLRHDQNKDTKTSQITGTVYIEGNGDKEVTFTFEDKESLTGTLAFESYSKPGAPIMDSLTVEEVLVGEEENKPSNPNPSDDEEDEVPNNGTSIPSGGGTGTTASVIEEKPEVIAEENVKQEVKYEDVANNHWAYEAINTLSTRGIVKGDAKGQFNPQVSLTRADAIVLLLRCIGYTDEQVVTEGSTLSFKDVKASAYYAPYLEVAKTLGLVNGRGNGNFAPNESISRQDMMVLIAALLEQKELGSKEQLNLGVLEQFSDGMKVAPYAKEAVVSLLQNELVVGTTKGIEPDKTMTRAECAVLIDRLLKVMES